MRTTLPLLKQHIDRAFKKKWNYMSKKLVSEIPLSNNFLKNKPVIVDATDLAKEPKILIQVVKPELSLKEIIRNDSSKHPHWKEKSIYQFNRTTKLIEGTSQIQVLLKTVIAKGLPEAVEKLEDNLMLPDQDQAVQQRILNCFVQDATQIRLPKRIDPINQPGKTLTRVWGVPLSRQTVNLSHQLLHLCSMALPNKKDVAPLPIRTKLNDTTASVFVTKDSMKIEFSFRCEFALMGSKALSSFGEGHLTENETLPNIKPLSPFINLNKINIYNDEEILAVPKNASSYLFPQLIGLAHNIDFYWKEEAKIVRGIAASFTHAVAIARRLYGENVVDLPQPVCIHCINSGQREVTIISYQLNTLNLDGQEGLKNQVWIDGPHQLYENCTRENGVENYNPIVFRKVLAAYSNTL